MVVVAGSKIEGVVSAVVEQLEGMVSGLVRCSNIEKTELVFLLQSKQQGSEKKNGS